MVPTLGLAIDGAAIALTDILNNEEFATRLMTCINAHLAVLQQRSRHAPGGCAPTTPRATPHSTAVALPRGVLDLLGLAQASQDQCGDVVRHRIGRTCVLESVAMLVAEGLRAQQPPEGAPEPQQEGCSTASSAVARVSPL